MISCTVAAVLVLALLASPATANRDLQDLQVADAGRQILAVPSSPVLSLNPSKPPTATDTFGLLAAKIAMLTYPAWVRAIKRGTYFFVLLLDPPPLATSCCNQY